MKTILTFILQAKFILACWTLGLSLPVPATQVAVLAEPIVERFELERRREKEPVEPPPIAQPPAEIVTPQAHAVTDARPVVDVHTLRDPKRPGVVLCRPCETFHAWHAAHGKNFPIRFEFHEYPHEPALPQRVREKGVPLFHWLDGETGKAWDLPGWGGPDSLLDSYQQKTKLTRADSPVVEAVPPLPSLPHGNAPTAGESPLELFSKFAGSGKFSWIPDKPVGAYARPDLFVKYRQLNVSVKLVDGKVVGTILDPKPEACQKILGLWFTVQVLQFGTDPAQPGVVEIIHSRGRVKVTVEDLK